MSFADRVKETTKTQGTGTISLLGAEAQHQSFVSGFGAGANRRYGLVSGDGAWEIGEGTVTDASPDTLSRDTVYSSSNSGNKITLTDTSVVFSTLPATLILDSSNNLSDLDDIATARTNLGLVAGVAGDIWVEKAGDVMTGQLEIRNSNPVIRLRDTGTPAGGTNAFVEFGGTSGGNWSRTGWVGDGSSGDNAITLWAEVGNLKLGDSSSSSVLTLIGGNAIFSGAISLGFGDLVSEQNPDVVNAIRLKGTSSDVDIVLGDTTGYFSVWNVADNKAVFYVNNVGDTDIAGDLTVNGNLFIGIGAAGVDYKITVDGETNDGVVTWMEDEDHWRFNDDIALDNGEFLVFDKAVGQGIKVDTSAGNATFGWADLLGDQFSRNTGATKATLTPYNGAVDAWQFSDGDEAYLTYHIPHDYVAGTDIHLHIHWSQTSSTVTGGTIGFKYFAIYAKGHNQVVGSAFTSTPITASFSSIDINDGGSGLTQYQHHLTEVIISGASATAALFDRDDFEPDGVVELTLEMDANSLTDSVAVQDPFIHYVDLHYQTTGLIGTKDKAPDFYA